jgi:hypothetical protein
LDESYLHLLEFNARAGKPSAVTATTIGQSAQALAVSIRLHSGNLLADPLHGCIEFAGNVIALRAPTEGTTRDPPKHGEYSTRVRRPGRRAVWPSGRGEWLSLEQQLQTKLDGTGASGSEHGVG